MEQVQKTIIEKATYSYDTEEEKISHSAVMGARNYKEIDTWIGIELCGQAKFYSYL
ncbi:hypothetical protein [Metabacillus arenae]|uniref:Uncharacterized protein n=1 Tax=Metabacillus arenae TaxID=2771434 RepID=A0A926NCP5_9BACI|nr:hypothetical protein [Metabacillus arenae]MBD1379119.1 hypothetical protein [Metabacillus arenae]